MSAAPTGSTDGATSSRRSIGYHLEQANRWVVELGPADERAISLAARAAASLAASGKRAYARGDGPAAANLLERSIALLTGTTL